MYIEIGTIVGIIFFAIIIILGIKSHLDNKDIERKREEEKRLEEEKRAIWRKNQEEKEQQKKEYQIKEIFTIMNCSEEQAGIYWKAMSDFMLLSKFDSWEHIEYKKQIVEAAIGYHEYFVKELLPIIQKNNYELTESNIGVSKKSFYGKNFSLISNETKLKMLNDFDYYAPYENGKTLLGIIKEEIATKITERDAMSWSPNLTQEDFDDIVIAFAEKFGFVFAEIRPRNNRWGDPYKYDYESLESIWVQSLLSSQNKDDLNEDFFKYSELFFDAVYYDIRDYKNVIKKIEEMAE